MYLWNYFTNFSQKLILVKYPKYILIKFYLSKITVLYKISYVDTKKKNYKIEIIHNTLAAVITARLLELDYCIYTRLSQSFNSTYITCNAVILCS